MLRPVPLGLSWLSSRLATRALTAVCCTVPRSVREALTSWDRTLFDVPIVVPNKPAPGVYYDRLYDLGEGHFQAKL